MTTGRFALALLVATLAATPARSLAQVLPRLRVIEAVVSDRFPAGCTSGPGCSGPEAGFEIVIVYVESEDGSELATHLSRSFETLELVAADGSRTAGFAGGLVAGRTFVAFTPRAGGSGYSLRAPSGELLPLVSTGTAPTTSSAPTAPEPPVDTGPAVPPGYVPAAPTPPAPVATIGLGLPAASAVPVEAGWPAPDAWGPDGGLNPWMDVRTDWGWVIVGAIMFVGSYVFPIFTAADVYGSSCVTGGNAGLAAIPVVGAFVWTAGAPSCYFGTSDISPAWIAAGLSTVGQLAGVALFAWHLAVPASAVRFEERSFDIALVSAPDADVGLGVRVRF